MQTILKQIAEGKTLDENEAFTLMAHLCAPDVCQIQAAAVLALLHARHETREELFGFVRYLRQQAISIAIDDKVVVDIVGTGGDHAHTFNISTAAALLLASTGVAVAKHGGRSVSSRCGSADVVEALGLRLANNPHAVLQALHKQHFAFIAAAQFNPAFQNVSILRKTLGIRTCFNLLGPLLNPLPIKRQVVGVYSKHLLLPFAEIMRQGGAEEIMVVHAQDGLDEFSIAAPTDVLHFKNGKLNFYTVNPRELGIMPAALHTLRGGDAKTNAAIIESIFAGEKSARRDSVVLNAAAGLVVAGVVEDLAAGLLWANAHIDSGKAQQYLAGLQHSSGSI